MPWNNRAKTKNLDFNNRNNSLDDDNDDNSSNNSNTPDSGN